LFFISNHYDVIFFIINTEEKILKNIAAEKLVTPAIPRTTANGIDKAIHINKNIKTITNILILNNPFIFKLT
jgi:hypothetical protein